MWKCSGSNYRGAKLDRKPSGFQIVQKVVSKKCLVKVKYLHFIKSKVFL